MNEETNEQLFRIHELECPRPAKKKKRCKSALKTLDLDLGHDGNYIATLQCPDCKIVFVRKLIVDEERTGWQEKGYESKPPLPRSKSRVLND